MILESRVFSGDAFLYCDLGILHTNPIIWDARIYISTQQSTNYYADIFHFWVRSFYDFCGDMRLGSLFTESASSALCKENSIEEFQTAYYSLLHNHIKDEYFQECQAYPQSYIEIDKRTFSQAYIVLDRPDIKSAVASSDGEYVAYFQIIPGITNP